MSDNAVALVIPVSFFVCATLIYVTYLYFKHRSRLVLLQAVETSLDKTGNADPSLVKALAVTKAHPNADLRKGSMFVAIGLGITIFAHFVDEQEAIGPLLGIASFPGLVGLTYLGLHFFANGRAQTDAT